MRQLLTDVSVGRDAVLRLSALAYMDGLRWTEVGSADGKKCFPRTGLAKWPIALEGQGASGRLEILSCQVNGHVLSKPASTRRPIPDKHLPTAQAIDSWYIHSYRNAEQLYLKTQDAGITSQSCQDSSKHLPDHQMRLPFLQ